MLTLRCALLQLSSSRVPKAWVFSSSFSSRNAPPKRKRNTIWQLLQRNSNTESRLVSCCSRSLPALTCLYCSRGLYCISPPPPSSCLARLSSSEPYPHLAVCLPALNPYTPPLLWVHESTRGGQSWRLPRFSLASSHCLTPISVRSSLHHPSTSHFTYPSSTATALQAPSDSI